MAHVVLTVASPGNTVFAHSGGDLEVIISKESTLRAGAEVTIQYETSPASGVYKTLPLEEPLIAPTSAVYQLSACNVKAVLVGGDAEAVAEVRLVSVV